MASTKGDDSHGITYFFRRICSKRKLEFFNISAEKLISSGTLGYAGTCHFLISVKTSLASAFTYYYSKALE